MDAEIWSVMDIICCHFRLFFSLTTWKIKLLKNWKNTWRYYHFTHVYHIGPFKSLTTQKIEIVKKGKKPWRYYHFTHVYGKWQSNDLWFLRYGVRWRECFVILDPFLHLYRPKNLKIKLFKKMEKTLGDSIISHMCIINDNHIM